MKKRKISFREEANAITCHSFRNGFIEDLHSGKHSKLLENPKLSRITQKEMKKLMIESSGKIEELLSIKEKNPKLYWELIKFYNLYYVKDWDKNEK